MEYRETTDTTHTELLKRNNDTKIKQITEQYKSEKQSKSEKAAQG